MTCKRRTSGTRPSIGGGRRPAYCGLIMAAYLGACVSPLEETGDMAERDVPEDAIQVAPELYMLPMGTDEEGCATFQPWSPTLSVVQALHWRTAAGDYTLDRNAADCPVVPEPAPRAE